MSFGHQKENLKASPLPHTRHSKIAVTNDLAQLSVLDTQGPASSYEKMDFVYEDTPTILQLKVARPTNDPKALFSVGFISEQMRVISVDFPQPLRPQILGEVGSHIDVKHPHTCVRDLTTTTCYDSLKLENRFMPSGGG